MNVEAAPFGSLLRGWRRRRRLSQLHLAADAEISQRHLSFMESGRAAPSRDMVERLADCLDVPLRQRNALLLAAGFAPVYRERDLNHPDLAAARAAVERIVEGHRPHPAVAVDRQWNLHAANAPAAGLMQGVAPALLEPPVNVLRVSLHPDGLASRIVNYREWRAHVLARLARQADSAADPAVAGLLAELTAYPVPPGARPWPSGGPAVLGGIAVPFELATPAGVLRFISTTTVFGSATDIFLSELVIESFFPADAETAAAMAVRAALA